MPSLPTHIGWKVRKFSFRVLTSIVLCWCGVTTSTAQIIEVRVTDASAADLVREIEIKTGAQFNFSSTSLPNMTITTELQGTMEDILAEMSQLLSREILDLGDHQYAISASKTSGREEETSAEVFLLDHTTGIPIIGATVWYPSRSLGTVTDDAGRIHLPVGIADDDMVQVSYLGYEPLQTTVRRLRTDSKISLQEKEHVLDDIVIKSYRQLSTTRLTSEEIDPDAIDLPAAADQDAFVQAQMIPGVYNSSESLQDLQIRGGPPDQVSYNWNNMRLIQNSLFYGRVSSVNPLMVDQINVTRNGASADEDASASGAVNLQSDLSSVRGVSATAHLDGLYANLGIQASVLRRVSVKGAIRRSLSPQITSPIYDRYFQNSFQFGKIPDISYFLNLFGDTEEVTLVPTFSFGDASISAELDLGRESYIRVSALQFGNDFSYNQIKTYTNERPVDSLVTTTVGYSAVWQQRWSDHLNTTLNVGYSDYDYRYITSDDRDRIDTDFQTQENAVMQRDIRYKVNWEDNGYAITLGYDLYDWDVTYDARSSREWEQWLVNRQEARATEHSIYANIRLHTHRWYEVMLGLRRSDYSLAFRGRNIYEPRLHASIFASHELTFHAHFGRFHQNLNRRNFSTALRVENGFWFMSDEAVSSSEFTPIVQSEQFSAGAKYVKHGCTIQADVYKKRGESIWSSAFDFASDEDPYEFSTLDITGLELGVQYQNLWYTVMGTYDYVRDRIITSNSELELNSPYSQPHRLSIYQGIRRGPWSLSSQVVWASGRFFSTAQGIDIYYKGDEIVYDAIYDNLLDQQVPSYFRVDMGLGYHWQYSKKDHRAIDFKAQFLNILNRTNVIKNHFFVDYRSNPPIISNYNRIGLPSIVNFSIQIGI